MGKKRFVVVPGENMFNREQAVRSRSFVARAAERVRPQTAAFMAAGAPPAQDLDPDAPAPAVLGILDVLEDERGPDSVLVELSETERLALRAAYPDLGIAEEGQAEMALARVHLQPLSVVTMAGAGSGMSTLTVKVTDGASNPVKNALVQLIVQADPPAGVEAHTNAKGEARLQVPRSIKSARCLRVEPAHGYWHAVRKSPKWSGNALIEVRCKPLAAGFADALAEFGGSGKIDDGEGVTVAVIDGGAGPHEALKVAAGANLTKAGSPTSDFSDNGVGHGTHVAGIIAGKGGPAGIQGMAPGVELKVYRIYGKGSHNTGAFSIAAAIKRAVDDGADIINLSLTLPQEDAAVTRQIQRARSRGVVCVAAAGNSGGKVMSPASHEAVIGVAALGCRGRWPAGAGLEYDARPKASGRNPKHFVASFSCTGPEIDLAGAGVAVVSLFPGDRLAMMNGTSMAAPAVAGLIARKLAANAAVLGAARDQARSDAIVAMALKSARDLGFNARFQGRGVPA